LLAQHINNDENVIIISVELRVIAPTHRKIRKVECSLTFARGNTQQAMMFDHHVAALPLYRVLCARTIRTHIDQIHLPQVIVSADYDASLWKISLPRNVQFLH